MIYALENSTKHNMGKFRKKLTNLASIGIADVLAKRISAIFWFYVAAVLGPTGYG